MNLFLDLLQSPLVERLAWTLLHFLWQGTVVAALLALLLPSLRPRSANSRYLAGCFALLLMALAPPITFSILSGRGATVRVMSQPHEKQETTSVVAPEIEAASPASIVSKRAAAPSILTQQPQPSWNLVTKLETFLPWFFTVWLFGVLLLSLRLLGGWWQVQRFKRRHVTMLGEPWKSRLTELAHRLGVTRPVRLLKSALVEVPTVIGWLRPVILLPASALTGLTPDQLEAILAHELAHVRRHDYLVNLLQTVLETLLFYHPAVWWVSRRVRDERENSCDDLAVAVCGNRVTYARTLTALEELRRAPTPLALAADGSGLLHRIQRLLGLHGETKPAVRIFPLAAFAFITLLAVLLLSAAHQQLAEAQPNEAPQTKSAAKKVRQLMKQVQQKSKRIDVIRELGQMGLPAREAVPLLIQSLHDADEAVRFSAERALGGIGPAATEAVPELLKILKDKSENWQLRSEVAEALGDIDPQSTNVVHALMSVLSEQNSALTKSTVSVLESIAIQATRTNQFLTDSGWSSAFALITASVKPVLPKLIEMALRGQEAQTQREATQLLIHIAPHAEAVMEGIIELVTGENYAERLWAIDAAGKIGEPAKAAVPALRRALQDTAEVKIRRALEKSTLLFYQSAQYSELLAGQIHLLDVPGTPHMKVNLQGEKLFEAYRIKIFEALANIGAAAKAAMPILIVASYDKRDGAWMDALRARWKINHETTEAVQDFANALKEANLQTRLKAAAFLGQLGPEAKAAVPALVGALNDEQMLARVAVADALGQLGFAAKDAVPALRQATNDLKFVVRQAASEALKKIQTAPVPKAPPENATRSGSVVNDNRSVYVNGHSISETDAQSMSVVGYENGPNGEEMVERMLRHRRLLGRGPWVLVTPPTLNEMKSQVTNSLAPSVGMSLDAELQSFSPGIKGDYAAILRSNFPPTGVIGGSASRFQIRLVAEDGHNSPAEDLVYFYGQSAGTGKARVLKEFALDGSALRWADARELPDNKAGLVLTWTDEGSEKFGRLIQLHPRRECGIVVDGKLVGTLRLAEQKPGKNLYLVGGFQMAEADAIVSALLSQPDTKSTNAPPPLKKERSSNELETQKAATGVLQKIEPNDEQEKPQGQTTRGDYLSQPYNRLRVYEDGSVESFPPRSEKPSPPTNLLSSSVGMSLPLKNLDGVRYAYFATFGNYQSVPLLHPPGVSSPGASRFQIRLVAEDGDTSPTEDFVYLYDKPAGQNKVRLLKEVALDGSALQWAVARKLSGDTITAGNSLSVPGHRAEDLLEPAGIVVTLTEAGEELFGRLIQLRPHHECGIIVDGKLIATLRIAEQKPGKSLYVVGGFRMKEAEAIVRALLNQPDTKSTNAPPALNKERSSNQSEIQRPVTGASMKVDAHEKQGKPQEQTKPMPPITNREGRTSPDGFAAEQGKDRLGNRQAPNEQPLPTSSQILGLSLDSTQDEKPNPPSTSLASLVGMSLELKHNTRFSVTYEYYSSLDTEAGEQASSRFQIRLVPRIEDHSPAEELAAPPGAASTNKVRVSKEVVLDGSAVQWTEVIKLTPAKALIVLHLTGASAEQLKRVVEINPDTQFGFVLDGRLLAVLRLTPQMIGKGLLLPGDFRPLEADAIVSAVFSQSTSKDAPPQSLRFGGELGYEVQDRPADTRRN